MQNAECLLLFPVPLPRPGFYSQSLALFTSCVPAAACPGVDAALVATQYHMLVAGGPTSAPQLEAMLQQFFRAATAGSTNATRNASVGGGGRACTAGAHRPCVRTRRFVCVLRCRPVSCACSKAKTAATRRWAWRRCDACFWATSTCPPRTVHWVSVKYCDFLAYAVVQRFTAHSLVLPAGYGGENCKSCVAGFYRLEDKCVACPSAAYMLIFVYAGAISECLHLLQASLRPGLRCASAPTLLL